MTVSFADLTDRTRAAAYRVLEEWPEDAEQTDIIEKTLTMSFTLVAPRLDQVDGEWVMQMMWQVPDLLANSEYADGMDANKATWEAVRSRIADAIREDVAERAGELGLDPDRMRI